MGNKMCKKKSDQVDNAVRKSPTRFDRIINRLHLRPNAWKSESHLNQKQATRVEVNPLNPEDKQSNIVHTQPLSKSSDWTEVELSVPDHEDHIHLRNPKLALIFNSANVTPVPPPRKHKKNLREKIEAVAKSGLQAFQSKKPVEETLCVKKQINYKCPVCDKDETSHNRDHHHHQHNHSNHEDSSKTKNEPKDKNSGPKDKDGKRKKNLSVVSLPNYDELKYTIAKFDDIDQDVAKAKSNNNTSSDTSLPLDPKTKQKTALDNYITRCRSFGSLLPQQLKKIKAHKTPVDIESDDSFGGLEDWDLGLIEHYNPKEASLPRPRKLATPKSNQDIISDIESMIVQEEDIPKPPERRSESLVKKINRQAVEAAKKTGGQERAEDCPVSKIPTPPPSPTPKPEDITHVTFPANLPTEENGQVEHSSLMKILQKYSMMDRQPTNEETNSRSAVSSQDSSLTPSLHEFEKSISLSMVEDFINAEKKNTDRSLVVS